MTGILDLLYTEHRGLWSIFVPCFLLGIQHHMVVTVCFMQESVLLWYQWAIVSEEHQFSMNLNYCHS